MIEVRGWSGGDTGRFLRAPDADDDKYSRGVVALRTGSEEYPGAAVLGVEAAWRTDSGFVCYVGEGRAADAVLAHRPETVVGPETGRARVDAWVIGSGTDPGRRTDAETRALRDILAEPVPVVADAGALDLVMGSRAPLLVTPHAGEFARLRTLLGLQEDADRAVSVAGAATELGAAVLLKGARALIAAPDGTVIEVYAGTEWLATAAGTGDVLAGVLGGLLAANRDAPIAEVAAAGAWLHGFAGRLAAGPGVGHPIVALDVAESLPFVIAELLA